MPPENGSAQGTWNRASCRNDEKDRSSFETDLTKYTKRTRYGKVSYEHKTETVNSFRCPCHWVKFIIPFMRRQWFCLLLLQLYFELPQNEYNETRIIRFIKDP